MKLNKNNSFKGLFLLSLGALGVVYGDIGTSPLYSINEIFFGHAHVHIERENVLGVISIVLWCLTLIVAVKYIFFVLKADNDGEGGVFALYSILLKLKNKKGVLIVSSFLILAAGLLYGDGIITPAISVVSAVEGIKVATPALEHYIVPITIIILTALFFIQSKGTHKVGNIFGPIVVIWFISISVIGLNQIIQHLDILEAINPIFAVEFILHTPIKQLFFVMGSVMLVVTGGEAMYADMGHFGAKPIKISWFSIVYPALLLNYLGQGAFLLGEAHVKYDNVFYSIVPSQLVIPMVILATCATIIASQALISGAFSLTSQAISLGFLPRIHIKQTNSDHQGQIYIPFINWLLYFGCIVLVLVFKSSSKLAAAYGLAVSGIMLMTSIAMFLVSRYKWKWKMIISVMVFIPFVVIESFFLSANSVKLLYGGWIPLMIAINIFTIMKIWQWGRQTINKTYDDLTTLTIKDIVDYQKKSVQDFNHPSIFMTRNPIKKIEDKAPTIVEVFWKRYGVLPKNLIMLHAHIEKIPYVTENRYEITNFYKSEKYGSITAVQINFGFMEDHDVEEIVKNLAKEEKIPINYDPDSWLVHIISEKILPSNISKIKNILLGVYKFLASNSENSAQFFGLGNKLELTVEVVPVRVQ